VGLVRLGLIGAVRLAIRGRCRRGGLCRVRRRGARGRLYGARGLAHRYLGEGLRRPGEYRRIQSTRPRPLMAPSGHGATSDLSPQRAPKRTLTASPRGRHRRPVGGARHRHDVLLFRLCCPLAGKPLEIMVGGTWTRNLSPVNPVVHPSAIDRSANLTKMAEMLVTTGFEPATLRLGICGSNFSAMRQAGVALPPH
jgi:hypothetical protein